MIDNINSVFNSIDEIPLFYIESGSRLWGIESPDSDFDVRGFHLQSRSQYFDFKRHRHVIEIMNGDFDFVSYDIDKMFGLLAKSNPTVFEWIRAHLIYLNHLPDWNRLQNNIIINFDFKALFHHYISLAKGNINLMETNRKFTYKTVFYCIRGLLSADLASKQLIPELLINDLFSQFDIENDLIRIARESLDRKRQKAEKEEIAGTEKELILSTIKEFTTKLSDKEPASSNNRSLLENILRDYSMEIKTSLYR